MQIKKEDLLVFKRFKGLDTATLEQRFSEAAKADDRGEAAFRLGVGLYNMAPGLQDEAERALARNQALEIIADAAAEGSLRARTFIFDMARLADEAATNILERMNEEGGSALTPPPAPR